MEIKRRLGKIQKRLSPQSEAMNIATQMESMCDRFEYLLNYAEEKIERAERRLETIGAQVVREKQEASDAMHAELDKEARETAADQNQQQAQPGEDLRTEMEQRADEEADASRKKKAKKKTAKK